MPCKYHFIVSVGTSLVEKLKKHCREIDDDLRNVNFQECFYDGDAETRELKDPVEIYPGLDWDQIKTILSNPNRHSAEIKTVNKIFSDVLRKKQIDNTCCFHLISTRTSTGAYCTSVLKKLWSEEDAEQVEAWFPEGLEEATRATFKEKGLPNLLSVVAQIMEDIEEEALRGNEVSCIVVPTGGYKAIIPYLTIASIIYSHPAYYIYEESDELVLLPAPPLGVDVAKFRSRFALLQNLEGADKNDQHKVYYDALGDEGLKHLFKDDNTGKYKLNAFGSRMKAMFTKAQEEPLVLYATTNRLVEKLGTYKQKFTDLARIGSSVWIGDKAPEMADHARYHHLNLFSYAELLLLPILEKPLEKDKYLLKPEELFLLLGVIYLHDCGHTLEFLPVKNGKSGEKYLVPLLQTEIRGFHNILGYYRIMRKSFRDALKRQGVELEKDFLDAVARVSVYHRKRMPLLEESPYRGPDGEEYKPLAQEKITLNGNDINGDRLALIAALFRIIDGMDKQVTRTGDAVQIVMKAEAIVAELQSQWQKVCMWEDTLAKLGNEILDIAKEMIEDVIKYDENPAETGSGSEKECCGWKDKCENLIKANKTRKNGSGDDEPFYCKLYRKMSEKIGEHVGSVWEYARARVRFAYLLKQPYHYYTDLVLDFPRIAVTKEHDTFKVQIRYQPNKQEEIKGAIKKLEEICKYIKEEYSNKLEGRPEEKALPNLPKPGQLGYNLVKGIRSEYCRKDSGEVAQILFNNKILITFFYKDEEVACWHGSH